MKLSRVEIIMNEVKMEPLKRALKKYQITGMTVFHAEGCGVQYGTPEYKDEDTSEIKLLKKEVVVLILPTEKVNSLLEYVKKELYTGHIGDGKIFVSDITNVVRVRTGDEGYEALIETKD